MTQAGLIAKRAAADQARLQLLGTAHELQYRLSPKTIASDAVENAREKGEAIATEAVGLARRQPVLAGAAVAGILAFLARKPILRAFRSREDPEQGEFP